jgi:hypothetical protein
MNWLLSPPMPLCAGVAALWPLAAVVCRPTSAPRLIAKAVLTIRAVIALVWSAGIALWVLEQRW